MNSRDNKLAFVLLGFIVLAVTGFFGYQFYLVPMREREARITDLKRDVDEREARVDVIHSEQPTLEKFRQISLPKDVDLARRAYGEEIEKMLRASGFEPGNFSVLAESARDAHQPHVRQQEADLYPTAVHRDGEGRFGQHRRLDGAVLQIAALAPDSQLVDSIAGRV